MRIKFEAEAKRLRVGQPVDLKTLEGAWVTPQKYGVEANERVGDIGRRMRSQVPDDLLKDTQNGDTPEVDQDKLRTALVGGRLELKVGLIAEYYRTVIIEGLADHNMDTGGGEPMTMQAVATTALTVADVALEIVGVIQDFNAPLPKKRSKTSSQRSR